MIIRESYNMKKQHFFNNKSFAFSLISLLSLGVLTSCVNLEWLNEIPLPFDEPHAKDYFWNLFPDFSLEEIFKLDKTLSKLSALPCGFIAERNSKKDEWHIKRK